MRKCFVLLLFFAISLVFAEDARKENLYQKMLEERLKEDSQYKTLQLQLEITEGDLQKAKNSSIANLELGISDAKATISKEKARQGFSFNPYVNFSLPIYNNTGLRLSSPFSKMGDAKITAFNLTAFTELYGVSRSEQKLLLSIAQDKVDEALKECKRASKYVEKKLLKDIKDVLTSYLDALDKNLKEVQAQVAHNQLKVQGYLDSSAKVRTSRLTLLGAERDLRQATFTFETKYKRFLKSSGIDDSFLEGKEELLQDKDVEMMLENLYSTLPKENIIDMASFTQDEYLSLKREKRAYEVNKLKDELSINPVTVTGEAGFSTLKKTFDSSLLPQDPVSEHSFGASVNLKMPGTKIMTGLDFPLDPKRRGDVQFKFGFAINPIEIWNYTITKKNVGINDKINKLKLKEKMEEFDTFFVELNTKKNYFEWQKLKTQEELTVYRENRDESEVYLKRGLISSFEKMEAELEYKKAFIRDFSSQIDVNSFNIETSLMFDIQE